MKKHLLLIDDDIDEYDFIVRILQELPALRFSYACSGKKALDFLSENTPDVILLDMNMPAMNGLECLQKIRKKDGSVPVYMYSNCYVENFVNEAKELGATDCFKKPSDVDVLRKILVKVLHGAEN
jgi:DNA-binding NtrC family response regulator